MDSLKSTIAIETKRLSSKKNRVKNHTEPKFHFTAHEMLQLLRNAPDTEQNRRIVKPAFDKAMRGVNNKTYQEQRDIRHKYQATNGLVIKNIPFTFSRQECYDAILALHDQFRCTSGKKSISFPSDLTMMQFMFPKKTEVSQTAFPIFTSAIDRNILWTASLKNYELVRGERDELNDKKGILFLIHPKSKEQYQ